jgi:osmotically-inducible protein OsmY
MKQGSSVMGTLILTLIAVVIAPASAMAETTDSVLTAKAKIALYADEQVKGRLITVETVKGLVILRGKIDSSESKARASSVVEALPGVKRVRNDLQVTSLGDRPPIIVADADITRAVQVRLSQELPLSQIGVRSGGGTVALTGVVATIDVGARASELARGVPGVRSVANELTYDSATRPAVKPAAPRLPPREIFGGRLDGPLPSLPQKWVAPA